MHMLSLEHRHVTTHAACMHAYLRYDAAWGILVGIALPQTSMRTAL